METKTPHKKKLFQSLVIYTVNGTSGMWIIAENYIVQIEKVYDKKKDWIRVFYPMAHVKLKSAVYTVTEES